MNWRSQPCGSTRVAQALPAKAAPNRYPLGTSCSLHEMAPQVGLEPTTLRLTGGEEPFTPHYCRCMYSSLIKCLCVLQEDS